MAASRQRMIDCYEFNNPDKIPVVYHSSQAGLYVHGNKLLDLFNRYPSDNPISFESLSMPKAGTVNSDGQYHEFRRDEWGTEWEYKIFGVQGYPHKYPFSGWAEARDYQFPPLESIDRLLVEEQRKNYLVFGGWISILKSSMLFDQWMNC